MSDDARLRIESYPHRYRLETRRSDSVGGAHIPNAQLADYADDAREGLNLGFMGATLYDDTRQRSLVLAETRMRFLHEVLYPGPLTIGVGIAALGRSSVREVIGIFRDDRCLVLGECVLVKVLQRRPAPFTDEERALAERYMMTDQPPPNRAA